MGMFDMLGKLGELKTKMKAVKDRLDDMKVQGTGAGGKVSVEMTGNQRVTNISVDSALLHPDRKQELEEFLEIAMNDATDQARQLADSEMRAAGKGLLPDIPGLF